MDTGSIKPRPAIAPRSPALRDPVTVREAAATELGPARTVAPTSERDTEQEHGRRHDAPTPDPRIDPRSQEALLQAAQERDNRPESPNQALIRERAYRRQPQADMPATHRSGQAAPPDPHADIEA